MRTTLTDIPIIFSAPMVRALLDGRKTMTRRLAWRENWKGPPAYRSSPWQRVCVDDRLWVRENWRADDFAPDDPTRTIYMADAPADAIRDTKGIIKWRPCIHLPRVRSRLTLIVTATKIERLQDISEGDARAEGGYQRPDGFWTHDGEHAASGENPAAYSFRMLWSALHGNASWESNPEVVAITFRVIEANIDAHEAKAAAVHKEPVSTP